MATKKSADAETAVVAAEETPVVDAAKGDVVKMKDFLALVNAGLEGKSKVKRDAIDAVLGALSGVIMRGESFQLPGFGRGRVIKVADGMATLKLREAGGKVAGKDEKEPLADSAE